MSEDADRFRARARECRRLAEAAKSPADRESLSRMASELEQEAKMIDGEEGDEAGVTT